MFCDQSGFYLLPFVCRSYAPRGCPPILQEKLTHEHLSCMSGVTPEGRLYWKQQPYAFKGDDAVAFLKQLMRSIPGKLLVVWDRSPIHRSKAVKVFLQQGAAKRIHLHMLPPYAPELNPDEGVWRHLKTVELKNIVCQNRQQLKRELKKAIARLRYRPELIQSFFQHAGCFV